jgi:sigma-B regulation protein RsbU (phosphoserine phosphatase)
LHTGPSPDQATLYQLKTGGFAPGMVEGMDYESQTMELGPFARLLIFSDGVYEIDRPDSPMWTFREFVEYIETLPRHEPIADRLLAQVRQLHASDMLADDFSFVEVWL